MKKHFSAIANGSPISLRISAQNKIMYLNAVLQKHLGENLAQISILYDADKKLNFDRVNTDMEFCPDNDVPLIWHNVKILSYQNDYSLQVFSEGTKHNRRNTFRVGISSLVNLSTIIPNCPRQVILRDLSLTGFSITDRKKKLSFKIGDTISVSWKDLDYELNLVGELVRVDERKTFTIYGFALCNICKDLPTYINVKQLHHKKNKLNSIIEE